MGRALRPPHHRHPMSSTHQHTNRRTVIPMSGNGHTITAGDVVPATVNGHHTLLPVKKIGHGLIHTADWRLWWYQQEGHQDGEPVHPSRDRLHTDQPAPAETYCRALVLVRGAGS